jgi:hypothetical protein
MDDPRPERPTALAGLTGDAARSLSLARLSLF